MSVAIDTLKQQLLSTENDLEQAKAAVYRCDGAMQLLKHLIAEAEAVPVVEGEVVPV